MGQKLGQHFLKDAKILDRIAAALLIESGDVVLEIGPGHGELTDAIKEEMARRAGGKAKLIIIEEDKELFHLLEKKYCNDKTVIVKEGDARKQIGEIVDKDIPPLKEWKLAGNIPYYLTGYLLRLIGDMKRHPSRAVITVQKEVAGRACAVSPRASLLSLSLAGWAESQIQEIIPRSKFSPPPRVDSAVIVLAALKGAPVPLLYFSFLRKICAQPRKTLINNLVAAGIDSARAREALRRIKLSPSARPAHLTRETVIELLSLWKEGG